MTLSKAIKAAGYNAVHFAKVLWPDISYGSQRNRMSAICTGKKPIPDELKRILKKLKIKYNAPETKNQ